MRDIKVSSEWINPKTGSALVVTKIDKYGVGYDYTVGENEDKLFKKGDVMKCTVGYYSFLHSYILSNRSNYKVYDLGRKIEKIKEQL